MISKLDGSAATVAIDLLGFGASPKPGWVKYSALTQARALRHTFRTTRIRRPVILVGHSLGSLVAIEFAKRYPKMVSSLILCSPPLYKFNPGRSLSAANERRLLEVYRAVQRQPRQFIKAAAAAQKIGLMNASFQVDDSNIKSYMGALEAAIINQTSLDDIVHLNVPATIIRGTLDPVLISRNISRLARENKYITVVKIVAGHEVVGPFATKVARIIRDTISRDYERPATRKT